MNRAPLFALCLAGAGLTPLATFRCSAALLPASALHGKKLLFVVGETSKERPSEDALVEQHLRSLGFDVTLGHEDDPASQAAAEDIVVISSTANPDVVKDGYRNLPVPVFTWNVYSYPYLAMTGPQLHRDFELIDPVHFQGRTMSALYGWCENPVNPIIREVGIPSSQNFGTYYLLSTEVGWGRPSRGGSVLASLEGDDGEGAMFTYERGATMCDNVVAPARRVGFYLSSNNFHLLSQAYGPGETDSHTREWYVGLKLFDAGLRWAVSPPPAPPAYDPAALDARLAKAAAGKKLLFVGRKHAFEGEEADLHIIEHLKKAGFEVTYVDQDDSDAAAIGQDMVLISATCSKYKLANRYADVKVPFMGLDPLMADVFGFAGRQRYKVFGTHGEPGESDDPATATINIVGSWSTMAAGLKPGPVQMIKDPDIIGWGTPGRAAIVIATLPTNPDQCPIYGYEKGATLANGRVNPARRVYFALDNPAYDTLTEQGHALFDACVLWCISSPKS